MLFRIKFLPLTEVLAVSPPSILLLTLNVAAWSYSTTDYERTYNSSIRGCGKLMTLYGSNSDVLNNNNNKYGYIIP